MSSKKFDYSLKYIIVGEAGVGKSNLLLRYVYDSFKEDYQLTIGVEFGEKLVKYNNKTYKIQIWDTAGQEQFRSITRAYFKSSICSFVVYDITNRETFENVKHWVEDCRNYMPKNVLIFLVGNKSDLEEQRKISKDEGEELADSFGLSFFETSAKNNVNVNSIFGKSLEEIVKKIDSNFYDLNDESCGIKRGNINNKNAKLNNNKNDKNKKKRFC